MGVYPLWVKEAEGTLIKGGCHSGFLKVTYPKTAWVRSDYRGDESGEQWVVQILLVGHK